jgi:hypothetical protein
VFLSVKDEAELIKILQKAQQSGITHSEFREPDIDNQLTAIALAPCEESRKISSSIPLALRELSSLQTINS